MQQKENFHWILRANLTKLSAFTFVYNFLGLYRSWKTWKVLEIFFRHFPGLSSPGKRLQFLECPKNLLNSSDKVFRIYAYNVFRPLGEFGLKSWDWKGLRWNLKYWKSLWIFSEEGYKPWVLLASYRWLTFPSSCCLTVIPDPQKEDHVSIGYYPTSDYLG